MIVADDVFCSVGRCRFHGEWERERERPVRALVVCWEGVGCVVLCIV